MKNLALSLLVILGTAQAQTYPTKPIRMVVPFAPGGSSSIVARSFAAEMEKGLGQSFVIENKGGGGGNLAMNDVAHSDPDGYSLIITHVGSLAMTPFMEKNLGYDVNQDFVPVSLLAKVPNIFVVHESVPAKNLKEFIALAKAQPGKLNYASSGTGTPYHMAGELFKAMSGTDIVHVAHKSSGDMRSSVIGGHVQMMFDAITVMAQGVRSGQLVGLGTTGAKRSAVMPEMPTIAEAGVPGYEATIWLGLMAPAATPKPIVDILNAEVLKVMQRADVKEAWAKQGAVPMPMAPVDFDKYLRSDIEKWAQVVKVSGAKAE
jgi:tripartite-type tricarboxylate transporter receptor subunit TctC